MNSLKVNEMVYKFQDLVEQKKVRTFIKFQNEIYLNFIIFDKNHKSYKFISWELKKMHAFLEKVQHFPNNHLLAQSLKPLFRMLVECIIIPKIVVVLDEKSKDTFLIKYADLILASGGRRLIQKTNATFKIPYRGKASEAERQRVAENRRTRDASQPGWLAGFLGNKMTECIYAPSNFSLRNELDLLIRGARIGVIVPGSETFDLLTQKLIKFYLETD